MINFNFQPFPILQSNRLILRELQSKDAEAMFALRSNSTLMQFVPRPIMQHKDEAITFINLLQENENNKLGINWAITINDILIGNICLFRFNTEASRAEIGYMINEENSGQGLMTEAVQLVVQYGFKQMQLNAIEALIAYRNIASIKVIEKAGFQKDGLLRDYIFFNNKYVDMHYYSLLAKEYFEK